MANKPITERESRAWELANELHKTQIRKFTGESYFDAHVQKVNGIVKLYSTDEDTLVASLLHDIFEDCFENKWDGYCLVKDKFGKEVADIVLELTSDKDVIKYKFDRNKGHYLIDKMLNMSEKALTIKLSDRLQNISDAYTASDKFRTSYYYETTNIVDALKSKELTKIQDFIFNDIVYKLNNIKQIYKMK